MKRFDPELVRHSPHFLEVDHGVLLVRDIIIGEASGAGFVPCIKGPRVQGKVSGVVSMLNRKPQLTRNGDDLRKLEGPAATDDFSKHSVF